MRSGSAFTCKWRASVRDAVELVRPALGAALLVLCIVTAPVSANKRNNCDPNHPEDCGQADATWSRDLVRQEQANCTSGPCMVLVNRSQAKIEAFAVKLKDNKDGGVWRIFTGPEPVYPFKWTKWNRPTDLPCDLTIQVILRYEGKRVTPDAETFDICRTDAKGKYLPTMFCLHYPAIDFSAIPAGYTGCTWPVDERRR